MAVVESSATPMARALFDALQQCIDNACYQSGRCDTTDDCNYCGMEIFSGTSPTGNSTGPCQPFGDGQPACGLCIDALQDCLNDRPSGGD
ncbi:MAG TPA: hypothetical protein VFF06_12530 [Polyangia bacterium]|nr:hypothetical protein [Polyangia bacterium]